VQLREIQRAVPRRARLEVRRLRELRELALGRRAAVPLLEPRRADAQVRGDRRAARGEHVHHLPGDALDLKPVPVIASGPFQAEPGGQGFLQVLGNDRGNRADGLVISEGVWGAPFPIGAGLGDVGDLRMDMQLHVAVAGGVLQPVRDGQVGLVPLAGLAAVDPGVVGACAGVAGLALEIAEPGMDGLPDHLVDLADQAGPVRVAIFISCLAGQAGVLAEGGVEDRDRLGQRDGQVKEQGTLAGLPGGFDAQFAAAFGGGVRLGGQQLRVQVSGFAAVSRRPAKLGAVRGLALTEQRVVRLALDPLAVVEAEGLCAGAPPASRRLSPALARLDVVAGRVLGRAAVNLLPDVLKVVSLAQRRDNCHQALRLLGAGVAELPIYI
jgi:hypothetical protein